MSDENKEREILMVMRKVLGSVIRDITPAPGTRHPLSDQTIQDVRLCLGLITSRERELADAAGVIPEKPYYTDEKPSATVIPMDSISRINPESDKEDN
ncbi:MAG: segregation and condensation protein A [Gammaproteobacteria bacterium]|nr:segregation and condensation protein A [Gammaproteobacteria bacterium]